MEEIIGSMLWGFLLLVIYAIAVMLIGFFFSHVFNKKYPNLSAGWIMALPTLHIVNGVGLFWVVMYVFLNGGYGLALVPSAENKIRDGLGGHLIISFFSFIVRDYYYGLIDISRIKLHKNQL